MGRLVNEVAFRHRDIFSTAFFFVEHIKTAG